MRRQRRREVAQVLTRAPAPFFDTDVPTAEANETLFSSSAVGRQFYVDPVPQERSRSTIARGMGASSPHEDHSVERPRRGVVVLAGPLVRRRAGVARTVGPRPLQTSLGFARVNLNRRDYVCVARAVRRNVLFALGLFSRRRGGSGGGSRRRMTADSRFHCGGR